MPSEFPAKKVCPLGALLVVGGGSKVFLQFETIVRIGVKSWYGRWRRSTDLVIFTKLIVVLLDGSSQSTLGVISHCSASSDGEEGWSV